MKVNLGIDANGHWHTQFYGIGKQLQTVLIINNMDLARALKSAGVPRVIHRFTNPDGFHDEGYNEHRNTPFPVYAEKLAQAHGYNNKDIILSLANEASTELNLTSYRTMNQYFADAMEYLAKKGFILAGYNSPPASCDPMLVDGGAYDPLIEVAHKYPDNIILCFHDYDDFALVRFGANDEKDYSRLDDRGYVAKENWSKRIVPGASWHLYHYTRVIERARKLGKRIKVGITEIGYSNIDDDGTKGQVERLNRKYPKPPVNAPILNGQMTLHNYWADVYPQWSWDKVCDEQLRHYLGLVGQFYPEVIFATFYAFAYGDLHGQNIWNTPLVERIIAINGSPPLPPKPPAPPVTPPAPENWALCMASPKLSSYVHLRKGTSTSTESLYKVGFNTRCLVWFEGMITDKAGYKWLPMKITHSGVTIEGYVRRDVVRVWYI
jgi:hypothetical protein